MMQTISRLLSAIWNPEPVVDPHREAEFRNRLEADRAWTHHQSRESRDRMERMRRETESDRATGNFAADRYRGERDEREQRDIYQFMQPDARRDRGDETS